MQYDNLLGRPFELGRTDCFKMVRDFYKQNYDIELRNYARPRDWQADTTDIIGLSYEQEGFDKVTDWSLKTLQPGDLLCMAISSSKPNHLAIYVGDNTIVHHKVYTMSSAEVLRDFWRNTTCYVLRHKDVPNTTVEKPTVTIQELLDERNRLPTDG